MIPPAELTTQCPVVQTPLRTESDIVRYIILLEETLEECNLKQEKELQWFKELQENLDDNKKR